jgi:hypothetical protein
MRRPPGPAARERSEQERKQLAAATSAHAIELIAAAASPQQVVATLDRLASFSPYTMIEKLSSLGFETAWDGDDLVAGSMPGTISFSPAS